MNNHIVELVSVDDNDYVLWGRKYKEMKRRNRIDPALLPESNNYEQSLGREHKLWEEALRRLTSLYVNEYHNRILKFRTKNGEFSFREIDFIAEVDKSLLFCEIKSKNHCDFQETKLSYLNRGWKQAMKSYEIASGKYPLCLPLLMVVDMSYIFDIDYKPCEKPPNYVSVLDLKSHFNNLEKFVLKDSTKRLIWLNSEELFKLSREVNILTDEFLIRFRNAFNRLQVENTPRITRYSTDKNKEINNPFGSLKHIKAKFKKTEINDETEED